MVQGVVQKSSVVVFEVAVVELRWIVAIVWIGSCNQNRLEARLQFARRKLPRLPRIVCGTSANSHDVAKEMK
jgi:hypothetical protein